MEHDGGADGDGNPIPPSAVDMPGQRPNEIPVAPGESIFYHRDVNGLVNSYLAFRENSGSGALSMHGGSSVRLRTNGYGNAPGTNSNSDTGGHYLLMDDSSQRMTQGSAGGHIDLYDDANRVISRVSSGGLVSKMDDVQKQISHTAFGASSVIDGAANAVHHAAGTIATTIDGTAQKITHTAGGVQAIIDGGGKLLSLIVPGGGIVGLGALASTLNSANAVINQSHLSSFESFLQAARQAERMLTVTTLMPFLNNGAGAFAAFQALASIAHISVPAGSPVARTPS